ncbi:MAG: PaaI family thioesterase [Dehalococcoidia bacterium]
MSGEKDDALAANVEELKAKSRGEPIASFLGLNLVELSPGYAKVTMEMRPEYQNFNGIIYGGIIMSAADLAFAYASNSMSPGSVASQFNLHFVAGARVGDTLTAECRVLKSGRKVGVSEMTVTNQEGKLLAKATGTTIPTNQTLI